MRKLAVFIVAFFTAAAASANPAINSLVERMDAYEQSIARMTDELERSNFELRNLRTQSERQTKDLQLQITDANAEVEGLRRQNAELRKQMEDLRNRPAPAPIAARPEPVKPVAPPAAPSAIAPAPKPIVPAIAAEDEEASFEYALSLFDNSDFEGAVIAFADNIKAKGDTRDEEFYENLLYMGLSFSELGMEAEACKALLTVVESAPSAEYKSFAAGRADEMGCK
ncbi:MAG: hypothetical protein FWD15_01040 [Alphaproteobacteria bacterium]|nr:hypothetical protein [Alphaproteobacteria bacterium]